MLRHLGAEGAACWEEVRRLRRVVGGRAAVDPQQRELGIGGTHGDDAGMLIASGGGQLCVFNLCISLSVLAIFSLQRLVFGKLRTIEWQRLWERLLSYLMGQLVVLGAVVEPDVAEFGLWGGFSLIIGVLGLYAGTPCRPLLAHARALSHTHTLVSLPPRAGLSRDRLEYMAHLPELPRTSDFAPVVALALAILTSAIGLTVCGVTLLWEATVSTLVLFLFPAMLLTADSIQRSR